MSKKNRVTDVPSPKKRGEWLAALRAQKMAADPHAFVRASAQLFYDVVEKTRSSIPKGPAIWICGDCHSENIGAVPTAHGSASLDPNDVDETVIGYPAHDLLRLALDVVVATRSFGLRGVETLRALRAVVDGYVVALSRRSEESAVALDEAPPRLRKVLRGAAHETQAALLDHRVPRDESGQRRFAFGPRYLPLSREERRAIEELVTSSDVRTLIGSMTDEAPDVAIEVVDAAFRVAGTGSLGAFRAAVLVRVGGKGKKKDDDDRLRLVDVKEALPCHAPARGARKVPRDDAERVVRGARALVPALGERMLAASVLRKRVVVRELMPQEHKVTLVDLDPAEAIPVGRYLGEVIGRAHGRQMHGDDARAWAKELVRKKESRALPPEWMFEPLLDLVSTHEVAYLRHCAELAREARDAH